MHLNGFPGLLRPQQAGNGLGHAEQQKGIREIGQPPFAKSAGLLGGADTAQQQYPCDQR
ncbi:MAG: hypothetical protein P8X63_09195 [Desulfuromonadaceae bacterium]